MQLDIHTTSVVYRSPIYKVWEPYVAVAEGVAEDGRSVVGIGSSFLSEDSALDEAVEDLKHNARTYEGFSFSLSKIEDKVIGHRIEFLENRGEVRTVPGAEGLKLSVEVFAEKDGREVTALGKPGNLNFGIGPDYRAALHNALDDVESQLERVGTATV